MNAEELLAERIRAEIDFEILVELYREAGVSEKEIEKYSKDFWFNHDTEMNRKIGNLSNKDVHNIKGE